MVVTKKCGSCSSLTFAFATFQTVPTWTRLLRLLASLQAKLKVLFHLITCQLKYQNQGLQQLFHESLFIGCAVQHLKQTRHTSKYPNQGSHSLLCETPVNERSAKRQKYIPQPVPVNM